MRIRCTIIQLLDAFIANQVEEGNITFHAARWPSSHKNSARSWQSRLCWRSCDFFLYFAGQSRHTWTNKSRCVFLCRLRWELVINDLWHGVSASWAQSTSQLQFLTNISQMKVFSPVWVLIWSCWQSFRAKYFWQSGNVQQNGFWFDSITKKKKNSDVSQVSGWCFDALENNTSLNLDSPNMTRWDCKWQNCRLVIWWCEQNEGKGSCFSYCELIWWESNAFTLYILGIVHVTQEAAFITCCSASIIRKKQSIVKIGSDVPGIWYGGIGCNL